MELSILNSKEISVPQVISLIRQSSDCQQFCNCYETLVRKLCLADDKKLEIYLTGLEKLLEGLPALKKVEYILEEWKRASGPEATLENLMDTFSIMGFNKLGSFIQEAIEAHNYNTPVVYTQKKSYVDNIQNNYATNAIVQYTDRRRFVNRQMSNCSQSPLLPDNEQNNDTDVENHDKFSENRERPIKILNRNWMLANFGFFLNLLLSLILNLVFVCFLIYLFYHKPIIGNPDPPYPPNPGNQTLQITADSYNEYQRRIHRSHPLADLNITLILRDEDAWPVDVPLEGAERIQKLTLNGKFISYSIIMSILKQTKNVKHLHFAMSSTNYCEKHAKNVQNDVNTHDVLLNRLETVIFENISECKNAFDFLSKGKIANIMTFEFINGVINPVNIAYIQDLLTNSKETLRKLRFQNIQWVATLFEDSLVQFPKLVEIEIVNTLDNIMDACLISETFCQTFPALSKLAFKKVRIPSTDFSKILECSKLSHLNVALRVPVQETPFKLTDLPNAYPSLESLSIAFFFPDKGLSDKCYIDGILKQQKRFKHFSYGANCQIIEV